MIRQIIAYLAVFLLTLYCFFLYDDEIVTIMLIIEAIYFVAALLWLKSLKKKIDISMEPVIPMAEKNQEIPIVIAIRNRSKIPGVHVKLLVQVENLFTGEKEKFRSTATVGSRGMEKVSFSLKVKNCGNIDISIKTCWIYDALCILKEKWVGREVQRVGILPECHLVPVEVTRKTREFIVDAEEYSDRESGDDPSEIYQIREYREKDSLHDIHWKLSAKADELLVKEHGRPLGCVVLIWINLQTSGKAGKNIPSVILEAAASLSFSLLEAECVHMVAWYEAENRKIQKKRIGKEENVYELLNRLLYMESYRENIDSQYEDAFRGVTFSTVVELCTDGTVYVNKEEKMKIPAQEDKVVWEQLYFIV